MYHDRTAWCCAFFVGKKCQQRISTKKCCPCTMNIAFHVKQSSKTTSFGGTLSWRWRGWKSTARVVPTATTRILQRRFPGSCETVGQVFKFVWRLRWKINAVCMSLSPFVSFQSRFVTYLLTYSRIWPGGSSVGTGRRIFESWKKEGFLLFHKASRRAVGVHPASCPVRTESSVGRIG